MKFVFCLLNLLLLFSVPLSLRAQLKGKYNGAGSILFCPENKFEYEFHACKTMQAGKGSYQLTKDSLFLRFESDSLDFKKEYAIIITSASDSSNIHIRVSAFDMRYGNPLYGLILFIGNEKKEWETFTDEEGKADIIVPKSNDSLIFRTLYEKYNAFSQKLIGNKNHEIQLFMKESDDMRVVGGTIYAYKILKMRKNKLVLMNENGNIEVFRKPKIWHILVRRNPWHTIIRK